MNRRHTGTAWDALDLIFDIADLPAALLAAAALLIAVYLLIRWTGWDPLRRWIEGAPEVRP
jgi:hypothetical protein